MGIRESATEPGLPGKDRAASLKNKTQLRHRMAERAKSKHGAGDHFLIKTTPRPKCNRRDAARDSRPAKCRALRWKLWHSARRRTGRKVFPENSSFRNSFNFNWLCIKTHDLHRPGRMSAKALLRRTHRYSGRPPRNPNQPINIHENNLPARRRGCFCRRL